MSRCFPFPPPGYEKKATIEDKDLLTKENHKDKKHKKDKKDKEKKEGKEKKDRDKERSKEKNRDKTVRKEKHKDKKDRDKDKDKEKNCTSDAKKFEGQPECCDGEKLGSNCLQNKEIKDSKFMQDLARRIKDGDGATGSQIGQKIVVTNQRGGKLPGRLVERGIDSRLEEKEKAKDKKVNGQRNHVEARGLQNAIVQGFSGTDEKVFQGIVKPVENNDICKQVEKEKKKKKIKHKESDSKDDKYKDEDREKKSRSKDKDREKERKEEEKTKEITDSNKDLLKLDDNSPKLKESGKDFFNSGNIKPPDIIKTSSNSSAGDRSLGKRKELEINGILHDNGIRPKKLPRPVSSSLPVMENGRKPAIHFASEQGAADNHKVDMKERKINGLMEVPQPSVCSTGPLSTIVQVSENGEASSKQPHPDSKYLNQILSLPKVEDWSDLDDQEWLFSGNSLQSKKSKVGSPRVDGTQVWAEALQIETDDLIALPYVIPY